MTYTIQQLQPVAQEDTIDLAKRLGFLGDNKWLIASIFLFAIACGLVYLMAAKPVYESNILIQVEDRAGAPRNILGDVSSIYDMKVGAASEMEILRSRLIVSRAVENVRLYIDVTPRYFPLVGEWLARHRQSISDFSRRLHGMDPDPEAEHDALSEPGVFGYGGYVWGNEKAEVSRFNVPESLEGAEFSLTADGQNGYRLTQADTGIDAKGRIGTLLVVPVKVGTVELVVDQMKANRGAKFTLVRWPKQAVIEDVQKVLKITEQGKQSGIISVSLEGSDAGATSTALNEIGRQYIRQNEDRKAEEAEKSLVFLNKQMPDLRQELERSESKYSELRRTQGTIDLSEETKGIVQRAIASQIKLQELKQKREELLTRFENEHPFVEAVNQQIREVNHDLAGIDAKIRKLPSVEQNVVRLSRDVKVNTDLYTSLMTAAQQLRLATANKMGSARLLDTAVTAIKPAKPKPVIVLLLAAGAGLVVGVIVAYTRKVLYGTLDDPDEVERLGLPIYATIPHSTTQRRLSVRTQSKSRELALLPQQVPSDGAVESLRRFRTSLQMALQFARNNVVMITGPSPNVGKSFVSANLATVLASVGKKVLLIDGDLRTGHLHRYFGFERRDGLSEAIRDWAALEGTVHRNVVPNLDFVSTGALSSHPSELLAAPQLGQVLEKFSAAYDVVLIDTPPVLAVSDALTIAEHAGTIFHIVRSGMSTVKEIEESVKRLNQAGHAVTGVVFNDLKPRHASYGYGSRYGKYVEA